MHLLQGGLKLNGKWTNDELLLAVQGAVIVEHC